MEEDSPRRRPSPIALIAALVLAGAGAWAAPRDWPSGEAVVVVSDAGGVVVGRRAVRMHAGAIEPQPLVADTPGSPSLALPRGIPERGQVVVRLHSPQHAGLGLDAWRVHLELADGRREMVPLTEIEGEEVVGRRRVPHRAPAVLALLGAVIVLWLSEALPLWVTSLLVPCVLVLAGSADEASALAPFFHPIIALFFAGFLMAEAMQRSGLGQRVALLLFARVGRSPVALYVSVLGVSAFFSMWMSNTATMALLIPIVLSLTAPLQAVGYRKVLVLGAAYAATLGGVASAIGTPANPLAMEFLSRYAGRSYSFADWFAVGLPLLVLFLPVLGCYLWWRMGAAVDPEAFASARERAVAERKRLGRLTRAEAQVVAVFVVVVGLWLTQSWHGLSTAVVALAGAVVLAGLGRILSEDLSRISWASLLTFGGGLAMGSFMTESGVSDWAATRLTFLAEVPDLVAVSVVALVALLLSTVASNTASAAMLIPLSIPLARMVGVDPAALVLVVALASSIDFALVIGTPPTMIAYATKLFSAREIFRVGIVLDLLGLVLLVTAVFGTWHLIGLL